MARIPEEEIERLKKAIAIERLVTAYGVELKRHGKNLVGRCPWHTPDKTPSLVITPEKNLWNCLGACQTGGSVFDWVMKAYKVSFRHAYEILKSGDIPAGPVHTATPGRTRVLPPVLDLSGDDQVLIKQAIAYYHQTLKESAEGLAYLKSRGITSPEIIERFRIGFANRTLGLRVPPRSQAGGAELRNRLQRIGILKKSGHDRYNGSLVIPVFDEAGDVREIYGRKITVGLREGTPDHMYLPEHANRGVFNVEALARYPEIILCEALIDALTFLNAGFPNVTAAYGVNGFTAEHRAAFQRYGTKRVLIAYDRDEAGEKAASHLAEELMASGIECFRVQFPNGMDANEYALKVMPAPKSLGLVVRKAVWMGKGAAPAREEAGPLVEVLPREAAPAIPAETPPPPREPAPPPVLARSTPAPQPPPPAVAARPVPAPSPAPRPDTAVPSPARTPPPPPVPPATPPAASAPVPTAPPASPIPPAPSAAVPIERHGPDVRITLGDRVYRIRNLEKNVDVGQLKVNVMVTLGDRFHVDALDLYLARLRTAYSREAALELGVADEVIKKDLGHVLRALEELQDEQREAALAPKSPEVKLTVDEEREALELLRDPRLLERILDGFRRAGVVGEETNLMVGILAAVSRLLEMPMAVVIQSSSAAGKSSLMEAILSFLPAEHQHKYSAMTGQSLFYMGDADLKNKVLAIAEEEGAERASYALKLLQSEGELTIASTGKDPHTGRHVTNEYHVQGPVMIFLTTTAVDLDEELLNRCVVLTVNENREQTRIIHERQRESQTLEGKLERRAARRVRVVHQNAQRLLRPLEVTNPWARRLTFRDDQTRTRRDHMKYLTLIASIALLHQHQRPILTGSESGETLEYVEVTRDDIRLANKLAHEVLGRSLDELPPQTRNVLTQLDRWVRERCDELGMARADFRFQRKDLRALTGVSETRARDYLDRLVALEYVLVHRGTRGQSFVYELLYDGGGQDGQPFFMGLIDPDSLDDGGSTTEKFAGSGPEFAGARGEFAPSSHPQRTPIAPGSQRPVEPPERAPDPGSNGSGVPLAAKNAVLAAPAEDDR